MNKPHKPTTRPRCGAKKGNGEICRNWSVSKNYKGGPSNGRCPFHGGKSTGAKTEEGKYRSAQANYKHGRYSKESRDRGKLWKQYLRVSHTYHQVVLRRTCRLSDIMEILNGNS